MPEMLVTQRGTVYPWQCDHLGHMNVMWYVGKFDEASWQLLGSVGLTASRFRHDSLGMAAVEQHIDYKRELHAGDGVTIRSGMIAVTEKTIRIVHEMTRDETGTVAAGTVIVAVHIEATRRKARQLPPDVRERAIRMIRERGAAEEPPQLAMALSLPAEAGSHRSFLSSDARVSHEHRRA
jgi:acyl-CoA thioester hydrolase